MPATRFIVLHGHIYRSGNIRKIIEMFVRYKIALADTKFRAHKAQHLINGDMPFPYNAFALFRCSDKSSPDEIITLINQVNNSHTEASAGADRGDDLLQDFSKTQFGTQNITQANQFFDLPRVWRF